MWGAAANQHAILAPMLVVMILTAVVWIYMYVRRISAMRKARIDVQAYTTPDTIDRHLPENVNYPAYNLRNLFELPVLFYAVCLYLFVTGQVGNSDLVAAWVFCIFRVLHSLVHCTVNIVIVRFVLYVVGAAALWWLLGSAVLSALGSMA